MGRDDEKAELDAEKAKNEGVPLTKPVIKKHIKWAKTKRTSMGDLSCVCVCGRLLQSSPVRPSRGSHRGHQGGREGGTVS